MSSSSNKVIKRELLTKHALFFEKSRPEDILWSYTLLVNVDYYQVIDEKIYAYRVRESSFTNSFKKSNFEELLLTVKKIIKYQNDLNIQALNYYVSFQFFIAFYHSLKFLKTKSEAVNFFISNKRYLKYNVYNKLIIPKIAISIFGIKNIYRFWSIKQFLSRSK